MENNKIPVRHALMDKTKSYLKADLNNLSVVLVGPRHPGNIGAVARAMKNMGVRDLAMVRPHAAIDEQSTAMACGADDILEKSRSCATLAEAIAQSSITIATSARTGRRRRETLSPREAAELLAPLTWTNQIAMVFGTEASGLSNEDVHRCQYMVCIPTEEEFSSLNLAQAVLLLCYEMKAASFTRPPRKRVLAPHSELDGMYDHICSSLHKIGFLHPQNRPDQMMAVLKRIFARAGLDSREARIIRGIMRQIDWYQRAGAPAADHLRDPLVVDQ